MTHRGIGRSDPNINRRDMVAGRSARPKHASARDRGRDLGHARRQFRPDAASGVEGRSQGKPDRILVAKSRSEEPDAHAQSQHDLFGAKP